MTSNKPRQQGITRPRPSLSCTVCKRRKVRCGKEQPFCANCAKEPEACKYEYDIHHRSTDETVRSYQNPSDPAESGSTSSAPLPSDMPLFNPNIYQNLPPANDRFSYVDGGPENSLPWNDLTTTSNAIVESVFEAPHKRHQNSDQYTMLQGSANGRGEGEESNAHKRKKLRISNQPEATSSSESHFRPFGYLSIQNGGLSRFVGDNFWGLIKGHVGLFSDTTAPCFEAPLRIVKEDLCETFVVEKHDLPENVPQPHIDSPGLAALLTTLPKKEICDPLLRSFSISVHPVHPLLHMPTFQTDYNNFWQWCINSDISLPDNKIISDPTFLCLMFSVLYCGAAASSPGIRTTGDLQGLDGKKMVEDLRKTFSASLKMCQHLLYPTLNTLTSSILAHSCTESNMAHLEDLGFVHMTIRVAQSMGLHKDGSSFGLDAMSCEMRRRIWWHVIWLDVQASILHGSQVCLGTSEVHSDVAMVSEIRDQDLSPRMIGLGLRSASPPSGATSVTMLLARSRSETVRFKRSLADHHHSGGTLGQGQFDDIINAAKGIQSRLDFIAERIPSQIVSGTNFIFANASPTTHEWLYSDTIGQATVWGAWARIMIVMLKTDVAISVQKPFLGRADGRSKQQQSMWNRYVHFQMLGTVLLLNRKARLQ